MASFDNYNLDIKSKMPEWWKEDTFLEPINRYTQELTIQMVEGLLTSVGVVQPINCWLSIPEEFDWYHHYSYVDDWITFNDEVTSCFLTPNSEVVARLPNTKRKCHAEIQLSLQGDPESVITRSKENPDEEGYKKGSVIKKLTLTNGLQKITFQNIKNTSTIQIFTKTNEILIDGEQRSDLVEGNFDKIYPTIKYADYINPNTRQPIEIESENKKTEISLFLENEDGDQSAVKFDLQIRLLKPTYVTEQKIRVHSVSAFPIESVTLFGYFCHPFNDKKGYRYLWSKKYPLKDRVTYDQIAKQFDCERFYVQVKFHGIDVPMEKGFPQEMVSDKKFQPNFQLDKWGKIFGLPRRVYKTEITEDEEPYTFPKYYNYPIEQDYWYEERIVNEYRFDEDAINAAFIKDDEMNNIASLKCVYPFMDDIWVYTETIDPDEAYIKKIKDIPFKKVEQIEDSVGVEWENTQLLLSNHNNDPIVINPKSNDVMKLNDGSYRTKKLKCTFCLNNIDVPHDIEITGIELRFKAQTNVRSNLLRLTEDSYMVLPYYSENFDEPVLDKVYLVSENKYWLEDDHYYTVGGEDNLFGEESISREQLFNGNDGKVEFEIGFINESTFLEAILYLETIELNIYYKDIPDDYSMEVMLDSDEMNLSENKSSIKMNIKFKNNSKKTIKDKEVVIITSPEIKLRSGFNKYSIELDPEKEETIEDTITFSNQAKFGKYDILIISDALVEKRTILLKQGFMQGGD